MTYVIPYVTAIVDRDMVTKAPSVVLAHEVDILRAVHGHEAVAVSPLDIVMGGKKSKQIMDVGGEFARCQGRYGVNKETGVDHTSTAYGTPRLFEQSLKELDGLAPDVFVANVMDLDGAEEVRYSAAHMEQVLNDERTSHNAVLVQKEGAEQNLRDQIAELQAKLAASQGADPPVPAGATQPTAELAPVASMNKAEVTAELSERAVEFDGRAGVDGLRALLAESRDLTAAAAVTGEG